MRKNQPFLILLIVLIVTTFNCVAMKNEPVERAVWSNEQANKWHKQFGWLRGCNFQPSTAVNQLEMWQEETFDAETIDRELGWAETLGFNVMRVYLHHLAWLNDSLGFKKRINEYLSISSKHSISTIFVIFDDCWNPKYNAGKQPEPRPGVHNSGWVQDPGDAIYQDSARLYPVLEKYVKDILKTFAYDKRIIMWDLYNEPGNNMPGLPSRGNRSMALLSKVFQWGRQINPAQPLTAGIWLPDLAEFNSFQIENSDVISYHCYENETIHQKLIESLLIIGKPLVCTEYMARSKRSLFKNIMPLLKQNNIGAINWGFVSGKTNTKYAWEKPMPDGSEPDLWFHDILRKDGTPYMPDEIILIKELTNN